MYIYATFLARIFFSMENGEHTKQTNNTQLFLTCVTDSIPGSDRSKGTVGWGAGTVKKGLSMSWSSKPELKKNKKVYLSACLSVKWM